MSQLKKVAFVALIGRPSSGKSTLLNLLCGEKVAIVSKTPQTTRNAIRGIFNKPEGQLIFVDTPGRHDSKKKFNKKLTELSDRVIEEADIILYILDVSRQGGSEEEAIALKLKPLIAKTIIACNKTDAKGADLQRTRDFINIHLPAMEERCFPISAKNNQGIDELITGLFALAPEGEALYDSEYYTDQETSFRIAEIIREQTINRLREELPHSIYIDIADIEFKEEGKLWVRVFIIVERESQKGMVVGKGGEMIKKIRLGALKELRGIFDWKIELDLRVKTGKDWRQNDRAIQKIVF